MGLSEYDETLTFEKDIIGIQEVFRTYCGILMEGEKTVFEYQLSEGILTIIERKAEFDDNAQILIDEADNSYQDFIKVQQDTLYKCKRPS